MIRSLTAAISDVDSDSSSDSGFSVFSAESIEGVLEDLRVDTTCLLDLEPLLRSPILSTSTEPTAVLDTARITWSPHQPYSDKVSARFPKAADDLVGKLGRANYARYLRCQEQKATNEPGRCPSDQTASAVLDSASSKFHDSGIGSSLPSSYAETVMSYGMGEGRKVRVPPLPARGKAGLPFECVACGKWVKISTNSAWKQHVYGDLEPWICLEADCSAAIGTFPSRNDWVSHLALDHGMGPEWRMIECPLCRVEIGPGNLPITRHMSHHLEEISLAALPVDCEFDEESDGSEPDLDGEEPFVTRDSAWSVGLAQFPGPKQTMSPFDLKIAVQSLGGYGEVSKSEKWGQVCLELGFRAQDLAEAASFLQLAYQRYVSPYEESLGHSEERHGEPYSAGGENTKGTANARDPALVSTLAAVQSPIEEDKTRGYTNKALAEKAVVDNTSGGISGSEIQSAAELFTGAGGIRLESVSLPTINIDFAPPTTPAGTGDGQSLDRETLSVPDRGELLYYYRNRRDMNLNLIIDRIPQQALNDRRQGFSTSETRTSSPHKDTADAESNISKSESKHPATFQCSLCTKRFTRAYNLRSHLRTHTDERPFVCVVCGKAFSRQHDRNRHEGLHSGDKKFLCRGDLKAGGQWGCGRRFARADGLGRHFRSAAGRTCINPLLIEEMSERSKTGLPQALIAQYPALEETGLVTQHEPDDEDGDEMVDGLKGRDIWGTAGEVANDAQPNPTMVKPP